MSTETEIEQEIKAKEVESLKADALAWRMVAKGFTPEASPMWFVVPGISGAENPILLFTSREVAEQYCINNPSPTGYSIYAAVAA